MNEDKFQEAVKQTQAQAEEAVSQLGGLLRKGADKLRQYAEKTAGAIREDIDRHPD